MRDQQPLCPASHRLFDLHDAAQCRLLGGRQERHDLVPHRRAVLWSSSMRSPAFHVENPSRVVSAYAPYFPGR